MKNLLLLLFTFFTFAAMAQTSTVPVLTGKTDVQKLTSQAEYPWFNSTYQSYEPDKTVVASLKKAWPKTATLIVFGGTWCSDTQTLLPKFYKTLDAAGIDRKNVQLYLLDEQKKSPEGLEKMYGIVSVPTFIVMQNGEEKGRIVESVQKSIEADLLNLLQ